MALTARAIVAREVQVPLTFETIRLDTLRPDEVVVEIHAVGICHLDVACWQGKVPVTFPRVLGHEGGGIIHSVGSLVTDLVPGDTVLLSYNTCGTCRKCQDNNTAYCKNFVKLCFDGLRLDGTKTLRSSDGAGLYGNFFGQSSFSSLALVNSRSCVKVPSDTDLELFAPLGCGIQTGVGSVLNTLNLQPGSTVAICGTGSVGIAAIMAAKIRKAKIIIGIDIDEGRLQLANKLGATHTLLGTSANIVEEIQTICGEDDLTGAVDTTGVVSLVEKLIDAIGSYGRVVSIGPSPPGHQVRINPFPMISQGKQYVGSNEGDSVPKDMIPYMLKQHALGNLPLEEIVTAYPVEDFERALEDMKNGKTIKPVLVWKKKG